MHEFMVVASVLLAVCALTVGAMVVATVLAVRAVISAVRPRAELARLRARAYGLGPAARSARLRLELAGAVAASGRTLALARTHGWPLGDAPALQHRLHEAARGLDGQLRALGSGGDPRRCAAGLAAVSGPVGAVVRGAAELRDGLLAAGRRLDGASIDALARDCAIESRALRG